jgi:hypothetical protein
VSTNLHINFNTNQIQRAFNYSRTRYAVIARSAPVLIKCQHVRLSSLRKDERWLEHEDNTSAAMKIKTYFTVWLL